MALQWMVLWRSSGGSTFTSTTASRRPALSATGKHAELRPKSRVWFTTAAEEVFGDGIGAGPSGQWTAGGWRSGCCGYSWH